MATITDGTKQEASSAGTTTVTRAPKEDALRRHATRTAAQPAVADRLRPRASLLASFSMMLGTAAVLAVLTGVLAGPGVAVGLLAAFVGIAGVLATKQRHVAGRGFALIGILLGLGAAVVGGLALAGLVPWLTSDSDQVMRVREWLEARLPWLFPTP